MEVVDDIMMNRQRRVKRHTGFRRRRVSRDILDSNTFFDEDAGGGGGGGGGGGRGEGGASDGELGGILGSRSSSFTLRGGRGAMVEGGGAAGAAGPKDSQLRKLFVDSATSASASAAALEEAVDAFALKELLQQAFKKEAWFMKFSVETSKMLLALVDDDFAGKIDYEQFTQLWATILKAKV